jgi:quinol monooxygenase YgiN
MRQKSSIHSPCDEGALLFNAKENVMPIYQTGGYRVKSAGVAKVKQAIKEFVAYVRANEPGTHMYLAWQRKDDPSEFLHLFIFEDEEAQRRHGESEAVRKFEAAYSPELEGGEVTFTDYEQISGKGDPGR